MKNIILTLILFSIVFAQNVSIETSAKSIQPGITDLSIQNNYKVYVNADIFGEYPELRGRQYSISDSQISKGLFLSSDGTIITDSSVLEPKTTGDSTLNPLLDSMIADAARIKHIQLFGIDPSDFESSKFYTYIINQYGSRDELIKKLESSYSEGKLVFSQINQSIEVLQGNHSYPASIVYSQDRVVLLNSSIKNNPTVVISNESSSLNGDSVYLVTFQNSSQPKTSTVFVNGTSNNLDISLPKSSEKNDFGFIMDAKGQLLGAKLNDGLIIDSNKLDSIKQNSGIQFHSSDTDLFFQNAVEDYDNGNLQNSKELFQKTIESYPDHSLAKEYLDKLNSTVKPKNTFNLNNSSIQDIVVIAIVILAVLYAIKKWYLSGK